MTCNFSIRATISVLRPIVSRTGSRKALFTSLHFDSPTPYLIIYARNGSLNVKLGCVSIQNLGAPKSKANITIDFQAQSNAGSTPGTVPVCYGVAIAQRLWRKRCVILMVSELPKSHGL